MNHDAFVDGGALHAMFHPATVAILGPTDEPDSLGYKALAGLTDCGFERSLVAVDSRQPRNGFGVKVYRSVEAVPARVDLAVVVTAGDDTLEAIETCARAGIKGVVVLSEVGGTAERRRDFARLVHERLRGRRTKLIGPGCRALMNPALALNVSPGLPMPVAGSVAFITQSGSLATVILDWSHKGIVGFSAFVSLGDMFDVGWGNLIDYFGADPYTRAILIHMESIVNIRAFLSAARAVAFAETDYRDQGGSHRSGRPRVLVAPALPCQRRRSVPGGASTGGGDPRGRYRGPLSRRGCAVEAAAAEGATADDRHQRRQSRRAGGRPRGERGDLRTGGRRAIRRSRSSRSSAPWCTAARRAGRWQQPAVSPRRGEGCPGSGQRRTPARAGSTGHVGPGQSASRAAGDGDPGQADAPVPAWADRHPGGAGSALPRLRAGVSLRERRRTNLQPYVALQPRSQGDLRDTRVACRCGRSRSQIPGWRADRARAAGRTRPTVRRRVQGGAGLLRHRQSRR